MAMIKTEFERLSRGIIFLSIEDKLNKYFLGISNDIDDKGRKIKSSRYNITDTDSRLSLGIIYSIFFIEK